MHLIRRDGKWHADFLDHDGTRRQWVLFKDKRASQAYANRLATLVACRIACDSLDPDLRNWLTSLPPHYRSKLTAIGLIGPGMAGRPSSADLEDYESWMESQDLHPRHISASVYAIRRCLAEHPDLERDDVGGYLKRLRAKHGRTVATSNRHLGALKAFCAWRKKTKRTDASPLSGMKMLNEELGRVHERTIFTKTQLAKLLQYVRGAGDHHGMTGEQRYWAYRLASELGLLAGEMRKLTVADFTLGKKPGVRLSAAAAPKRRTTHVLPIPTSTARGLRPFFKGMKPGAHPFPLQARTSKMLYADLKGAKIPHRDAHGRFRDFYSLRHTALTNLAQTSPLHVVKALARHRNITTTQRYTHATEDDMRAAMNRRDLANS